MYLKSIEIHGFKSFANKMIFKFDKGITGIVGPNGSGKSNVADAVRWVLGEQSAKQLRGAKMEDVIFAGTESRKPLGFASVVITFDNSDHKLSAPYDEVSVSRKVFRSGESEYMLNGAVCRLRDIQEIFMDTGIGREGYSIIGQGQIDKVLSSKPDDRRELFDEAAGIVKYKKRKKAAEKNLEAEQENLARVNDILSGLERRIGPLEKQDAKAREYLRLKETLKKYDVNMYLSECDRLDSLKAETEKNIIIVEENLAETREKLQATKEEYEAIEKEIAGISDNIDEQKNYRQGALLSKERISGEVNVIMEQIRSGDQQLKESDERIQQINDSINEKNTEIENIKKEKQSYIDKLKTMEDDKNSTDEQSKFITDNIDRIKVDIENKNSEIIGFINDEGDLNTKIGRYDTMQEQVDKGKAELSKKFIALKSAETSQDAVIKGFEDELRAASKAIEDRKKEQDDIEKRFDEIKTELIEVKNKLDAKQGEYHAANSKYSTLKSVAEQYDGYGGSVKRIMERKDRYPGIEGVIADIIKVDKRYETAVEIALGGNIQNIVTDNEGTAKVLIDFLKYNKAGRATFLPLTSVKGRKSTLPKGITNERGAIDTASKLVKHDAKYAGLIEYLLGNILIVDNIDNGLMIARRNGYSFRIVTLDGESLNAGGSMSGGVFKHSQNLLGRSRMLQDLEKEIEDLKRITANLGRKQNDLNNEEADLRKRENDIKAEIQELSIAENTARMNFKQAVSEKNSAVSSYDELLTEEKELKDQENEIQSKKKKLVNELQKIRDARKKAEDAANDLGAKLLQAEDVLKQFTEKNSSILTSVSLLEQDIKYADSNIERVRKEIKSAKDEILGIEENKKEYISNKDSRYVEIEEKNKVIETMDEEISKLDDIINKLTEDRDKFNESNKEFFDKRQELTDNENDLDKESFRLKSSLEKIDNQQEELSNYMWEEYELTRVSAEAARTLELADKSNQFLKKAVSEIKASIKALGDVNVNAIEEYKEVKEQYTLLKTQHDDIVEAEQKIEGIIKNLDRSMRSQFSKKFADIQVSFDKVFKELFGGGYGRLELVEDEDILTAGIRIIASPPGKKLQNVLQMSGGEKALTAIALLFAIQRLKPSPFCLLDEIEAALDDANVKRFAQYLNNLTNDIQFVIITHRRGTMNAADTLYGITMQEKGISALVSVSLVESKLDN